MNELYLGMISGTSIDGVDAVLVDLGDHGCRVIEAATTPFPPRLLARVRRMVEVPQTELRELGALDHAVGAFFAGCAVDLIARAGVEREAVYAIGHHGQTIFHEPSGNEPFSMQIGDPNVVAATTGISTVADFRRFDMAIGGQGAPLVPAFHAWCFGAPSEARAVVNIGGIANITALQPSHTATGFDTGPGNTLLDLWVHRHRGADYDRDGAWAASGNVDAALLATLLTEPYFSAAAPKSTGRELFNMKWLDAHLSRHFATAPADVQATLAELTARTICTSVHSALGECRRLIVCGGGAHNKDLMTRLKRVSGISVETTAEFGIAPDWVEGAAFAWLARARLRGEAGNVPTVTGARRFAILGGVYLSSTPKPF
ncbi:MAG: anhydro-N-acetylmuramic acid kinase [Gammaproteobacteria bacterium]